MPESVECGRRARDVAVMQEALADIIGAYERDFAKHPGSASPKIFMIWKSIPSQLAREIRSLIIRLSRKEQGGEYEDALQWLVDCKAGV